MTDETKYVKVKGDIEISATVDVPSNKNIMLVAAEDATIKRAAGFIGSMFTVMVVIFRWQVRQKMRQQALLTVL